MVKKWHTLFSNFSEKSIKFQVVTFIVVAITAIVFLLSVVTSSWVNQQYRQLMLNNAMQITDGLAQQAILPVLLQEKDNANDIIEHAIGFESVYAARILLNNYNAFVSRGVFPEGINDNPVHWLSTQISIETDEYWFISSPIIIRQASKNKLKNIKHSYSSNDVIGHAEILYTKSSLVKAQKQVGVLFASVGLISLIVLSFILYLGLLKLLVPLRTLSGTMLLAETKGKHVLAKVEGAKEIRTMANSFNRMMKVLKKQAADIERHRDKLESEVKERTQELVQARDNAISASQHKSEFLANMSHELRTPIQSIMGYGELVVEDLAVKGETALIEDMQRIAHNSKRLLDMINSLLNLAKVESGKVDTCITEVNFEELILGIQDIITPLTLKHNNTLIVHQNQTLNSFYSDQDKLEHVLLNLLSNACKFTENGIIHFFINTDAHYVEFIVKDTGIGLSKEQQTYIFEEFRQVDSSYDKKFTGTGLGLAISLGFVELLNGTLSVNSALNKGAEFTVRLPLSELK